MTMRESRTLVVRAPSAIASSILVGNEQGWRGRGEERPRGAAEYELLQAGVAERAGDQQVGPGIDGRLQEARRGVGRALQLLDLRRHAARREVALQARRIELPRRGGRRREDHH